MGIQCEYNSDLCLRNARECREGRRSIEECLPDQLLVGELYPFLKRGQRMFGILGEVPLYETAGDGPIGRPIAAIRIVGPTHVLQAGSAGEEVWTAGWYRAVKVFDPADSTPHFDGYKYLG